MKEFHSFARFAEHLAGVIEMTALAQHEALEKAAKVVEREAKREVGKYQDQDGPFAGWAELADSTKADRERRGYTENDPGLRSGEMKDSIEYRTSLTEAVVGSDDDNLVFFELGTSKQPPRSVLGMAAVHKSDKVSKILGEGVYIAMVGKGVVNGRFDIED